MVVTDGAGREKVVEYVNGILTKLKSCNIGVYIIGHTKVKSVKEKGTEEEYMQLTSNLNADYDGIFADKADVISVIAIEREIHEKKVNGVKRMIYFRSDDYFVDCGGRLEHIIPCVEYGAENYIGAIEDAIRLSLTGKTDKEIEERRKEEFKEKQEKENKIIEQIVQNETIEETEESIVETENKVDDKKILINEIKTLFSKADKDKKMSFASLCKKEGYNLNENETIDNLQAMLEILK